MKPRKWFDRLLYFVSVPACVSCGEKLEADDKGICKVCLEFYSDIKKRNCSCCSKVLERCTCANEYLERHGVKELVKLYRYVRGHEEKLPTNELIYALKRKNRVDVSAFLAEDLAGAIRAAIPDLDGFVMTSVPRRRDAVLKYGFDHAKRLAIETAKILGVPYVLPLRSKVRRAQKKLQKEERIENAVFDYKRGAKDLPAKNVILVDDLVTTGASMGACAMLLKGLGAKRVVGATLAIAYHDTYHPFVYTKN